MTVLRRLPWAGRTGIGALAALLLALRLLSPAGFMPAFDRGAVTIVVCPDSDAGPAPTPPHHHGHGTVHQSCPYAAAASPMAGGSDSPSFAPVPFVSVIPDSSVAPTVPARRSMHLRPFLRGPPLAA